MSLDINTKKLKKNAFRVTKRRGYTASRIRVPGGHLDAKLLLNIQEIADTYGDGTVHITTRQGFEIPGIDMKDIPEVNKKLQPIIEALEINQENPGDGYNAAGTRNVSACIGNNVCPFANYNTTNFAKKIEKAIFPNDLHFKIALTGCPNDCIKARMHDFGIIGMTEPQYERNRCVSCGACVRACKKKATGALSFENFKVVRTGKKNPRLAEDFILWVDEDSIIKIILNTYKYVTEYIAKDAPGGKEHIGYIIDRTGFMEFKKWALEGVTLSEKALMKNNVYWSGIHYTNGF